ncbi:hypothetical protein GCM10007938_00670 [Vibrio zhanjiangensis]|uniref:Uncharacterized protein n=1 Tax=Vibrio zhanjiangensis TaxID=1046128 RepID=A0ABQ6EUA3_9VIBR|nr:hypothetical protein [Vibrio zhanjiangensis]GLT16291.1 hypothetical protein GCM10007938_00670 [Vibrio zhanjiangensis]
MEISFNYNNQSYVNFDPSSELFESLDIPAEEKARIVLEAQQQAVLDKRNAAYQKEVYPMLLDLQFERDAQKEQACREKVEQINTRYPLPQEL